MSFALLVQVGEMPGAPGAWPEGSGGASPLAEYDAIGASLPHLTPSYAADVEFDLFTATRRSTWSARWACRNGFCSQSQPRSAPASAATSLYPVICRHREIRPPLAHGGGQLDA